MIDAVLGAAAGDLLADAVAQRSPTPVWLGVSSITQGTLTALGGRLPHGKRAQ